VIIITITSMMTAAPLSGVSISITIHRQKMLITATTYD
jgi:hypothetical protein